MRPATGVILFSERTQDGEEAMIPDLRKRFNERFTAEKYALLRGILDKRSGTPVGFRIAETPVFVPASLLDRMASRGEDLMQSLLGNEDYLAAARRAIPEGYCVANESAHPNFLTADFALVRDTNGQLSPRLVEIQAFPSVFAFQALLCAAYREAFELRDGLGSFLGGLDEAGYWQMLRKIVLAGHDPENVVLTEVDPLHQKTLPDFKLTAEKLGISVVDIASVEPMKNKLYYRNAAGRLVPIHRIYNRAIAEELIGRNIKLGFDLTLPWDVEWAGHPNWYFLISKFSVPWLSRSASDDRVVPPAVFLNDFLEGRGEADLREAGVPLPANSGPATVYAELLLKPLFSFAGKGIQFEPTRAQLEAIPTEHRQGFLLQQRMRFERTINTPHGLTQAEFRILYMRPDGDRLTPALALVRLGRGKMMGVDHNKNQEWVGASAAFFPGAEGGI
jgi:hypothetical protein